MKGSLNNSPNKFRKQATLSLEGDRFSSHRRMVEKKYRFFLALGLPLFCFCVLLLQYNNAKQRKINPTEILETSAAKKTRISDFDLLMQTILHPEIKCQSSVVLGGQLFGNTKQIDGDKVLCLESGRKLNKDCIVYSFGVNNEWSFEEAIQKYGCKVYAFDPSMTAKDHLHSKDIWFYKMGLSNNNKDRVFSKNNIWKMNTFDGIKKQLNHTQDQVIDVVKMDIEGSEFAVLENMLEAGMLKNVNHLCVEIHMNSFPYWNRVYRIVKRIEDTGLHLFSTRNNTIVGALSVPGEVNRKEYLLYELSWFRY